MPEPRTLEEWAGVCLACARAYAEDRIQQTANLTFLLTENERLRRLKQRYNELLGLVDQRDGPPIYSIVLERAERAESMVGELQNQLAAAMRENEQLKAVAKAAGGSPHTELTTSLRGDRRIVLHGGVGHSVDQPCKLCRALAALPESVKEEME